MGDAGLIQSRNSALGHAVVLGIDNVELLAGVDDGLDNLLCLSLVPGSGLLDNLLHGAGFKLLIKSAGTADLSIAAHGALDVDHVVLGQLLSEQPINSGIAFLSHVGDNSSLIQERVNVDHTVEEEHADALVCGIRQDLVPAGGLSGGDQQVIHTVGDELLGGTELLVVLDAVEELGVIAVLFGEHILEVVDVCFTIAGL